MLHKLGGGDLLEDLVAVIKSVCQEICSRNCGRVNILADFMMVTKSVSKEICWQKWGESACRFSDFHQICLSGNLLEEMGKG